jgi:hypothetical protein
MGGWCRGEDTPDDPPGQSSLGIPLIVPMCCSMILRGSILLMLTSACYLFPVPLLSDDERGCRECCPRGR